MSSPCRIAEIVQFSCRQHHKGNDCYPIPRFFRICPGRPAVEITKFVDFNEATGLVQVPTSSRYLIFACVLNSTHLLSRNIPVHAKPWRDIIRHALTESENILLFC
ncbi:hypothetical protein J132_10884 [Termitomyces sp. J132]|nr:hypothetical protein J132_10884 [Termitomyces sp. J132]